LRPRKARARNLKPHEIAALWHATDTGTPYHRLIRFLLLVGCRLDEAASLRYGDFVDGVWHQEDNKIDEPVKHKLSAAAMEIVGTGRPEDLVFPGRKAGRPMSGWSKRAKALRGSVGDSHWTQHDIRRTTSTQMEEGVGIFPHIIDLCTHHKRKGISAVYLHGEMIAIKLDAWERWAARLNEIVQKHPPADRKRLA
jgi:integrase